VGVEGMNIFKIFRKKAKEIPKIENPEVWGRQIAIGQPKSSISAKVIRKDGKIEDLGILTGGK